MRRLAYVHGSTLETDAPVVRMVFVGEDGSTVTQRTGHRSFRRVQIHGDWWRLQGSDHETGEPVYLREVIQT